MIAVNLLSSTENLTLTQIEVQQLNLAENMILEGTKVEILDQRNNPENDGTPIPILNDMMSTKLVQRLLSDLGMSIIQEESNQRTLIANNVMVIEFSPAYNTFKIISPS